MESVDMLVCLFAKAPLPGQVKTRMRSCLSEADCLALHQDLLRCCASNLVALSGDVQIELHVTERHPWLDALADECGFGLRLQRGRDLGARMSHAVRQGLSRADSVLLVGSDCPFVDADKVRAVSEALRENDAVMVPALDGGYVALALRRHAPELFCGLPWGGDKVAELTRQRLEKLQWRHAVLDASRDIDRPEDLRALRGVLDRWADRV